MSVGSLSCIGALAVDGSLTLLGALAGIGSLRGDHLRFSYAYCRQAPLQYKAGRPWVFG